LAVRNALRYFPSSVHATLAAEFTDELQRYGHIYMYRFIPHFTIKYVVLLLLLLLLLLLSINKMLSYRRETALQGAL